MLHLYSSLFFMEVSWLPDMEPEVKDIRFHSQYYSICQSLIPLSVPKVIVTIYVPISFIPDPRANPNSQQTLHIIFLYFCLVFFLYFRSLGHYVTGNIIYFMHFPQMSIENAGLVKSLLTYWTRVRPFSWVHTPMNLQVYQPTKTFPTGITDIFLDSFLMLGPSKTAKQGAWSIRYRLYSQMGIWRDHNHCYKKYM